MISKEQIADIYQLSPMQKGMLFHNLQDPTSYVCQSSYTIKGALKIDILEKSINELVIQHPVLRTAFIYEEGEEPLQVVLKERRIDIDYKDIRQTGNDAEWEKEILKTQKECKERGFDLATDSLFTLSLLQTGEETFILIWTFHHILMDGWCISILIKEFYRLYYAYVNGESVTLPPPMPYKDYILWLGKRDKEQSMSFWKTYLRDYEQEVNIPSVADKSNTGSYIADRVYKTYTFGYEMVQRITELAIRRKITVNILLQAVWGIVLSKYNNSNDIVFGSVMSGRPSDLTGIDTAVGLFINTVPVRVRYETGTSFDQLIGSLWEDFKKITDFQYELLTALQTLTVLKQDLVTNLYVFENYPDVDSFEIDQKQRDLQKKEILEVEKHKTHEQNNYPLTLVCALDDTLTLRLEYDEQYYDSVIIKGIFSHFHHLVKQILDNPGIHIADLRLLSEDEQNNILKQCTGRERKPLLAGLTIQDCFQKVVAASPNTVALVFEDSRVTYAQLNAKVNKLAAYLRSEYKVVPDDRVGLLLERSDRMIIAILAVLKAGGAYVPLEITIPDTRKAEIVNDAQIKVLVTESHFAFDVINFYQGPLFALDLQSNEYENRPDEDPESINTAKDLAYIMYTSGSTGIPKGVAIAHKSVVNLVLETEYGDLTPDDRILQLSNYAFDGSVFDIFGALLNGASLFMADQKTILSNRLLLDYIQKNNISKSFITTSLFNVLVDMSPQVIGYFDKIYVGGEQLSPVHIRKALYHCRHKNVLVNAYGPTETNTFATYYIMETLHEETIQVPIGKPLSGRSVYVLNQDLQINPYHVTGELYLGGKGLARGYWNREMLTQEKFISNPFHPEEKLYRTGDLGKLLPDGNFVCMGRKDSQVKLRGFRIELDEITLLLNQQQEIDEAVVLVQKDKIHGDKLVAYYKSAALLKTDDLKSRLSANLPGYMVPGTYIRVSEFPLTINGKLDRASLVKIKEDTFTESIAPANDTEAALVDIWETVLGKASVGTQHNFFDSGGDSLLAIKLMVRINKAFHTDFNVSFIFENPSIQKMAALISGSGTKSILSPGLVPIPDAPYYEASYSQRRLWLLNEINNTKQAYNIVVNYQIKGGFDTGIFRETWKALVTRHESLRTVMISVDGAPHQKVEAFNEAYDVNIVDLSAADHKQFALEEILESQSSYVFDLAKGPLVRCLVIRTHTGTVVLSLAFHHIITDGWSMNIIMDELLQLYHGIRNGKPDMLPVLDIQYRDYAKWLNDLLKGENFQSLKNYWLTKFSGTLPVLNIIPDKPRPQMKSFNGDVVWFTLGKEIHTALIEKGKETRSSLFMMLTALVKLLLYKYTGQEDIVLGSPIAGRNHEKLEQQVGFYVNTLALRTIFNRTQGFYSLLALVKDTIVEAFDHQLYPFDQLVSDLKLERDTSRSPLFDAMIVLQNQQKLYTFDPSLQTDFKVEGYPVVSQSSHFDLTFQFTESEEGISCGMVYNSDIFSRIRIERMAEHFKNIITFAVTHPETALRDMPYLSDMEYREVVETFNNTEHHFPENKSLLDLFEEQVRRSPDKIAVVYKDKSLRFKEVHGLSTKLALHITHEYGVKAGDRVGLLLDRSEHIIISILAVLKAGAAYVPVDPEFPSSRIAFIIEDASTHLLITDNANKEKTMFLPSEIFIVGEENLPVKEQKPVLPSVMPHDTAYVIYTSGSTGVPKGVLVSHRSVVNRIHWMWRALGFGEQDVIFQKTPYVFDVSVWELFMPVCYGATMVFCDKEVIYDPEQLVDHIEKYGITTIHFVPTMFNFFINTINDSNRYKIKTLTKVITSGEALSVDTVEAFKAVCDISLYNLYGPTEATVDVTSFTTQAGLQSIPIGKPIDNCQMYILNESLQPVAKKIAGELCIGGVGVAQGYLNRDELTASKFVSNPYSKKSKLYKTGDIGFWDESGNIEFLGRADDQVKIKGFRIELGEIQHYLKQCANVKEAIVNVVERNDGIKELEAFLLSDKTLSHQEILTELYEDLSEYMIPSRMYQIDQIPYTATGKVDRNALKKQNSKPLAGSAAENDHGLSAKEEILLEAVKRTLGLQEIGLADNFFHLGGDSIKAIIITSRLSVKGYKLLIRDMFKFPVLGAMAGKVSVELLQENQEKVVGEAPLTPIQQEIVLRNKEDEHHYNQAVIFWLKEAFRIEGLPSMFEKITEHHDALRIVFRKVNGRLIQYNQDVGQPIGYTEIDLRESSDFYADLESSCEALQQSIVLEEGPLLKIALIKSDKGNLLFMVTHHLVTDGVSLRIILEDLELLHSQYIAGEPFMLPNKTSSLKSWAEALHKYANEEHFLSKEKNFWKNIVARRVKFIPLDFDFPRNYLGDRLTERVELKTEETALLISKMDTVFKAEINDILVYALCAAVKDTFGNNEIVVTMEGHGREEIFEDMNINRTVGWFTSSYPVVVELFENKSIKAEIEHVKSVLRAVPDKGVGFGILKYLTKDKYKTDVVYNLRSQISFNYLGQLDEDTKSDIFEVDRLPTGNKMSPKTQSVFHLDISGAVLDRRLFMIISYNKKQYKTQTMQLLARNYTSRLRTVVAYIREISSLTPVKKMY